MGFANDKLAAFQEGPPRGSAAAHGKLFRKAWFIADRSGLEAAGFDHFKIPDARHIGEPIGHVRRNRLGVDDIWRRIAARVQKSDVSGRTYIIDPPFNKTQAGPIP